MALADGCGGHFGDEKQDLSIAKSSHSVTEISVQLMSTYDDVLKFKNDFFNPIKDDPNGQSLLDKIKSHMTTESMGNESTIVACRMVPTENGFNVFGFRVGDCMAIAYDSVLKQVVQLVPSCVTEAGTASLPDVARSFEIQAFETRLANDSLVFLMTDGVHDELPYFETDKTYANGLDYKERNIVLNEEVTNLFNQYDLNPIIDYVLGKVDEKEMH